MERGVRFTTLKFSPPASRYRSKRLRAGFKCPSLVWLYMFMSKFCLAVYIYLNKTMRSQSNTCSFRWTADGESSDIYRGQLYFDKYRNAGLWKKRFVPDNLKTPEDDFKTRKLYELQIALQRPRQIEKIRKLKNIDPSFGRTAITRILKGIDYKASSPTVGRILERKITIGD